MANAARPFIPLFVLCFFFLTVRSSQAMENTQYQLQFTPLSQPSQDTQPTDTPASDVTIESHGQISLSSDTTLLSFDQLSPTNPLLRTNLITADGTVFYSLFLFEDHALANTKNGQLIPDTTCDDGTCSDTTPGIWNNPLTYGFGYTCSNAICANGYLSLANSALGKKPRLLLQGSSKKTLQLQYKVNISGTQSTGIYQNTLTYFVFPAY